MDYSDIKNENGHEWKYPNSVIPHIHCGRCLKIRREDGNNKPCEGVAKLRSLENQMPMKDGMDLIFDVFPP